MRERIYLPIPILVEGKYDKNKLASVFSGTVLTTDGFGIFKNKERLALIRRLGENGMIVLCDPDGGGKVIRSHIASALPKDKLYHLYIPRIAGKEKRKAAPGREGVLGVEGMDAELLWELLDRFRRERGYSGEADVGREAVTKTDFYEMGLTGDGSRERRDRFAVSLGMPCGMTPNALLSAVNMLFDRDRFYRYFDTFDGEEDKNRDE